MIDLERRLEARFPHWFRGHRARLARPLLRGFGRLSRLDEAEAFLARHGHLRGQAFIEAALAHLEVSTLLDPTERERVPETGALLVVANHPCGALDALALLKGLLAVRRDVKVLANDFLAAVEPLRELLLPLRILGGRPTPESLSAVDAALARGECVVIFPAGEVSRLGLRYWSLADFLKRQSGAAERYIGRFVQAGLADARRRGLDGLVCGHIHRAALREVDGLVYANDGDWVESLTALAEDAEGRLVLLRHDGSEISSLMARPRPLALVRAA